MRQFINSAMFVMIAALVGTSAHAACGGGGFTPLPNATVQPTVQPEGRQESRVISQDNRQDSRASGKESVQAFDSQFLRSIGRLNLSHEQYTNAMKASREVRAKQDDRSQRNFDAKHELDVRLTQILTAEQMNTYLAAR